MLRAPRVLGLLGILLAASGPAEALDPGRAPTQYVHTAWQTSDGLPQNTVTAVAQTTDGYVWLGTRGGLVRFDGVRFTVYNTNSAPELVRSQVLSLLATGDGALWIGTWGGGLVRHSGGRFTRFSAGNGLPNELVSALARDTRGVIWVGTDGGGIARMDGSRFVAVASQGALGKQVRAMVADDAGLWVGTDEGLAHVQHDGTVVSYGPEQGLSRRSVRSLARGRDGALWVGTDHGLNELRAGRIQAFTRTNGMTNDVVVSLLEDAAGNLWIGTDGGGLLRRQGGRFASFTSREGLTNDSVLALREDREGNLWIGTNLGGLNQLRDGRVVPFSTREGLAHDYARAIYEDRRGSLWIGTEGGGLDRLEAGRVVERFSTKNGLSNDTVFAVIEDREGSLWVGTNHGLGRRRDGKFHNFHAAEGLTNDSVMALLEDRDGALWIGTYAGGLVRYQHGRFTAFTTKEGLSHDTVNVVYQDRAGTLWVGTRGGGLNRWRNGRFEALTTRDGLSNDLVFALHEDKDGALWIGTYGGGLNRYKDGRFSAVTRRQGLHDDVVHRILEDDAGHFWMSGNRGIFRVPKSQLDEVADGHREAVTPLVLGTVDGMRDTECNGGASSGTRTRGGVLWFPTVEGVVSIDPARLRPRSDPPPVTIETVLVDERPVPAGQTFDVPPAAQTLAIHFTALSFAAPEAVSFRYRLEGLEEKWIEAGTRRTAYYSKLPPGDYRFHVRAASADGVWNDAGAAIAVTVRPRADQTWWFRTLVVLAAAAAGAFVYRARVHRLQRQKAELERVVAERTADLNAANARLETLARVDGLTGLLNRRAFDIAIEDECRRAARQGTPLSLLMVDVDAFKAFNDRYGHPEGDACLRAVADAVRRAERRAGDIAARYGGEEMALILPGAAREAAATVAEMLRTSVEDLADPHGASPIGGVVTVSLGVASQEAGGPPERLIQAADAALYRAKRAGRNRVEVAPWSDPAGASAGSPAGSVRE